MRGSTLKSASRSSCRLVGSTVQLLLAVRERVLAASGRPNRGYVYRSPLSTERSVRRLLRSAHGAVEDDLEKHVADVRRLPLALGGVPEDRPVHEAEEQTRQRSGVDVRADTARTLPARDDSFD